LLLVLVAAGGVWQSYRTTAAQRAYVECQGEINDAQGEVNAALIASLADSRSTAAQEREATDALYRAIRADPGAFRSALERYEVQRAEADARRAANPLPTPVSRRC
jgi:hypothetical protein